MSIHQLRLGEEEELQLRLSKVGAYSTDLGEGDGGEGSDLSLDLPDSFDEDLEDVPVSKKPSEAYLSPRKGGKRGGKGVNETKSEEIYGLLSMISSDDFGDFITSQSNLNKLRKKHEEDLTLRERVCLRVGEVAAPLSQEVELFEQKLEAEKETTKSLRAAIEVRDKETERAAGAQATVEQVEEGYKAEVKVLTERCARLAAVIDDKEEADRMLKKQAAAAGILTKENERIVKELDLMRDNMEKQSAVLATLTESEKNAREGRADAEKAREMLLLDKSFLTKELREATAKANDYARRNEELSSRTIGLDSKVSALTEQLLSVQLKTRTEADERLEAEVRRLREEAAATAEGLRAAATQQAERETRVLLDAKASLESELEHARRSLARVTQESGDRSREHLTAMASKESELTEARGELRVRNFEVGAMRARAEEADSQVRKLNAEIDLLREQVALHQTTVYRMESEMHVQEKALSDELEKTMQRLRAYEALEESVDKEVMRAAAGVQGTKEEDAAAPVLKVVEGLPVSPERRIRQAVQLATQLAVARGELEKARAQIATLQEEREDARSDAEAQRRALKRMSTPQAYLVNKLAESEGDQTALNKILKGMQQELSECQAALRESEKESEDLRAQLASLVAQRGEADQLRGYLELLRASEQEDEEGLDEEEEEEEGDVLDDEDVGDANDDDDTYGDEGYEDVEADDDVGRLAVAPADTSAFLVPQDEPTSAPSSSHKTERPRRRALDVDAVDVIAEQRSVSFLDDVPAELRDRMTTLDTSRATSDGGNDMDASQTSGSKSPGWHKRVVLE